MPRVKINKQKYMLNDLSVYITRQMRANGMNQADLGLKCGCSQQQMSYKLRTHNLYAKDLMTIFTLFNTSPDEIAKLLKEE